MNNLIYTALRSFIEDYIVFIIVVLLVLAFYIGGWVRSTNKDLSYLKTRFDKLEGRVEEIYKLLLGISGGKLVSEATSPMKLTDYGKELSQEIDAEKIADMYVSEVMQAVKGMNPYDIQQYCFEYVEKNVLGNLKRNHVSEYNQVSEVAYNKALKVDKLVRVIGIVLRDKVFHLSGHSHDDLDEHTPAGEQEYLRN